MGIFERFTACVGDYDLRGSAQRFVLGNASTGMELEGSLDGRGTARLLLPITGNLRRATDEELGLLLTALNNNDAKAWEHALTPENRLVCLAILSPTKWASGELPSVLHGLLRRGASRPDEATHFSPLFSLSATQLGETSSAQLVAVSLYAFRNRFEPISSLPRLYLAAARSGSLDALEYEPSRQSRDEILRMRRCTAALASNGSLCSAVIASSGIDERRLAAVAT